MAMLSAAINLNLDGREGFARVRDPRGLGPFDYEASDGGYTLISKLTIGKALVRLSQSVAH